MPLRSRPRVTSAASPQARQRLPRTLTSSVTRRQLTGELFSDMMPKFPCEISSLQRNRFATI